MQELEEEPVQMNEPSVNQELTNELDEELSNEMNEEIEETSMLMQHKNKILLVSILSSLFLYEYYTKRLSKFVKRFV